MTTKVSTAHSELRSRHQQYSSTNAAIERQISQMKSMLEKDSRTSEEDKLYDRLHTIEDFPSFSKVVRYVEESFELKSGSIKEKLLASLEIMDSKLDAFESNPRPSDMVNREDHKDDLYDRALVLGRTRLLDHTEIPKPWMENPYILAAFRFHESHGMSARSVLQWHNETTNIWTHIMGFALLTYLSVWHFPSTDIYQSMSFKDKVIIYIFLVAAIKCLISSVTWHTFNATCHLHRRANFACVDYTGITILITASILTTEYAALYYRPWLLTAFISFSAVLGCVGFWLNWSPKFDRPDCVHLRIGFFVFLAAMGVTAGISLGFVKGAAHAFWFYSPLGRSFIWYLTGVFFYGTFIPERFRNENDKKSMWWVDYVLSSHNIWHVFVLLGILGHYSAILEMFANIPTNM